MALRLTSALNTDTKNSDLFLKALRRAFFYLSKILSFLPGVLEPVMIPS